MTDEFKPEGTPVEGDRIAPQTITPIQPVAEEPQIDQAQQQQAEAAPAQRKPSLAPAAKDAEQAMRFKAMRESSERAERERDEALRRLQEYERQRAPEPEPESINIKDDDLVEGKHVKKLEAELRQLKAEQKQFRRQTDESSAEVRIRAQFPDFDKVATVENLQVLSEMYPELAKSINATTNIYDKAVSAYQLVKKFGIYEDEPFAAEKQQAISNTQKPKPLASISPQQGETPLSRANAFAGNNYKLTADMKEALRKEMEEASKRY